MKLSVFKVSMSLAASWAWGTSLIVGMELIQTKGLMSFIIWAVANSLALPLFGFIAFKIPNLQKIIESKPVLLFTTVVSVFCLWIQMNAIYQQVALLFDIKSLIVIKLIVVLSFILLGVILYNNGIVKSIFIDFPLWGVCYGILMVILVYALLFNLPSFPITLGNDYENFLWAINSSFILFSGPVMCIQNWQVAKLLHEKKQMYAHYIAGALFAVYMVFVGILGTFVFDGILKALVVIAVLIVALSTADSAIVGLQEIAGKRLGLCIEILTVVFWPFVTSAGVMGLWTTMGNMRKYVALLCVLCGYGLNLYNRVKRRKNG